MLSLRNRFGIPGVISVIALVFAMFGGAYAADNSGDNATASAKNNRKGGGNVNNLIKRESRKFSKRFSLAFSKRFPGPIGPRGFPGLPGAPGEDGDDGDDGDDGSDGTNGSDGADGANGKSVEVSGTAPGCVEGGATVQVEGEPTTAQEVCNGEDGEPGDPWTAGGTLPVGETQTGTFALSGKFNNFGEMTAPVSFAIPLAEELDGSEVHAVRDGEEYDPIAEEFSSPENCLGTTAEPTAPSGELCVYVGKATGAHPAGPLITLPTGLEHGAGITGAVLVFLKSGEGVGTAKGTWAVTG